MIIINVIIVIITNDISLTITVYHGFTTTAQGRQTGQTLGLVDRRQKIKHSLSESFKRSGLLAWPHCLTFAKSRAFSPRFLATREWEGLRPGGKAHL